MTVSNTCTTTCVVFIDLLLVFVDVSTDSFVYQFINLSPCVPINFINLIYVLM